MYLTLTKMVMTIKKMAIAIGLLLCISFAQAEPALESFLSRLEKVSSMSMDFEQKTLDNQGLVLQAISGQLSVARPGKMRWQTQPPYEQLVVSDGQSVWIYDQDLEQVTIRKLEQRLQDTPALLLSGKTQEIADNFSVSSKSSKDRVQEYLLTPLDSSQLFEALEFDYSGNELDKMRIYDAAGQMTEITFSNQKMNPQLDVQAFVFDIPEGVDVIDGRNGF